MAVTTNLPLGASLNGTSFTITNSGSLVDGDFRTIFIDVANTTVSAPSGWTQQLSASIATSRQVYVFTNVHNSASPAGTVFTIAATNNFGYVQVAMRGMDTTTPINVAPVANSNATAGTALDASTISPTVANTMLLCFYCDFTNSASATLSTPTGMAIVGGQAGNGTNGHSVQLFSETRSASGATSTRTSTSNVSAPWGAVSMAIAPAIPVVPRWAPFFTGS